MIEADSVLSTPRTGSSSNIIAFAPVGRLRRNPNRALSLREAIEIAGEPRAAERAARRPAELITETCRNTRLRHADLDTLAGVATGIAR